ncbi:DUF1648 domain-containing protein [Microbispora hainanensis]|uniref:DUF1648 domain-containing protein n=1 Tax=Microbispora hainanensis TaxID=568844 RepID=A0A544Z3Y2_9ACTN|nr:DUF1648 domain-containing protein [Microbispora hainanensis]TQS23611.1 DUF1648 domain-containing protein [Microbispora hainanensis]
MTDTQDISTTGFRTRFLLAGGAWFILVAAVLVAVPLVFSDRLPDPVATHWGPSGAPDGSAPAVFLTAVPLALWVVLAVSFLAFGRRRLVASRAGRAGIVAGLAWTGIFLIGVQAVSIAANLGRSRWQEAAPITWQAILVVAVAVACAMLAGWAARRGPDEPPPPAPDAAVPGLALGRRVVWLSSASAPLLLVLSGAALAASVAFAVLRLMGLSDRTWHTAAVLAVVGLAGFALSTVSVRVSSEGMRVAFGPLRWPARRVPLDRIDRAWVEERYPSQVGGWGYRGLPGRATIMVRGGACLVVRYTSGGQLAISVDDAERGAALLNALVAHRGTRSP